MKNGWPSRLFSLIAALACILCLFAGCGAETAVPENGQAQDDSAERAGAQTADDAQNDDAQNGDAQSGDDTQSGEHAPSVGLAYEVGEDGVSCTVTGMGTCTDTALVIPEQMDGYAVTGIGSEAFLNCTELVSVTILNGATKISNRAFSGCTGLTTVTIPDSVTSIGNSVFSGCSSLVSMTIPFVGDRSGVTIFDRYQYPFGYFFGTRRYEGGTETTQYYYGGTSSTAPTTYFVPATLRSVTVTGGNILFGAFSACVDLTNITICGDLTNIGGTAFYQCTGLTSVTLPGSVTSIDHNAFDGCTNLASITFGGTKVEWGTIRKDSGWNANTGKYTVHCTNGDVSK